MSQYNGKFVIISPFSRVIRNGLVNPKNYPYWSDVVAMLQGEGMEVVQIGIAAQNEPLIGADRVANDLSFTQIRRLVHDCSTWASVDNFFPHLCSFESKIGVVVFSQSDPRIFGYPQNINLLKDQDMLRVNQFDIWENAQYREDAFVPPDLVCEAILSLVISD